jgi:hypothetical protein
VTAATVRVEESQRRLMWLRDEISEWTECRRQRDPREQFATQLSSLQATLVGALGRLSTLAEGFAPTSMPQAYELCRDFDDQLLVVRRLWRWFADKFDQRDNPRWTKTLAAADEVAWSIYAGIMRAAHGGRVPTPAPLPYLDGLAAPEAVPRDQPPPDLRPGGYDEAMQLLLARLPVPVVGLPVSAREAPWELALLGHEVGHHLQYDLMPHRQLVESVGETVATAAGGGPTGDEWRWWSRELFADLVGLVTLGPSSLAVLLPLELGTERYMLDRERDRYPAPAVRVALILAMAAELGLAVGDDLLGTDPEAWVLPRADDPYAMAGTPVRADLDRVPGVATALVTYQLAGRGPLKRLSAFSAGDFRPEGAVGMRARQLAAGQGAVERGLPVVRSLVSAGVVAWRRVSGRPDLMKRAERLQSLGETLVDRIVAGAEEGTRAARDIFEVSVEADLAEVLTRELSR